MEKKSYIGLKAWDMGFDAHLTVHYLGDLTRKEEGKVRAFLNEWKNDPLNPREFLVMRDKIDLFGPTRTIPVVRVIVDAAMLDLKTFCKSLPSPSEYGWNPHITLDLNNRKTIHIPRLIKLTSLSLY